MGRSVRAACLPTDELISLASMPRCGQCGKVNREGALFCQDCGARIVAEEEVPRTRLAAPLERVATPRPKVAAAPGMVACPACGVANPAGMNFCKMCGIRITGGVAAASARVAMPAVRPPLPACPPRPGAP